MAWLRDSDDYTQRVEWDGVSYEARWHYKAMIEYCSRSRRWDGRLPLEQALRVSDVPDPDRCIAELEAIGYAIVTRNVTSHVTSQSPSRVTLGTVTLPRIDEHIPPRGMRDNASNSKLRMQRKRAHDRGEHHLCLPKNCPQATPPDDPAADTRNTRSVTRNPGTGRDRSFNPRVEGNEDASTGESGQSGLVGGAGGGARDVTRNTAPRPQPGGELGNAVQDRRGIRWLTENLHAGAQAAELVIRQVRADARARGIPINSLPAYLASMHENGDLTDVLMAAQDRIEGRTRPWGSAEPEPATQDEHPDFRVIDGRTVSPQARRAAIDACPRCDHNGLTREDRPRRCDHRPPGHASQPPLMKSVPDQDGGETRSTDGLPADDARRTARTVMDRLNQARRQHG
ncbi:hypothetical protein [Actinomadura sp. WMMA1423]|uniref:hypothetical protein n=1 Tax=Actinomadura sp. WMMA1423 TaxID=2591108 RepID=UPI0011473836|nr:hypothetical protein [Actinomadura sp. WMMA1423]